MQPVWVLSVDLQTKTATFQSGMADAARSARGAFNDIKTSAGDATASVSGGTTNVRAALGLLDNTIRGNHAAAMADMIREFKDSAFVMAALPFAAVAGGLLLVAGIAVEAVNKFREYREEQLKLADDNTKFGTAIQNTFNELGDRILEAGAKADELDGNHLAALRKQLELIDHQSLKDLVKSFEEIERAADASFSDLQSHWYTFGIGSEGAKHALDEFKIQYESLLSQGKDTEASNLLSGTLQSAKHILALQKEAAAAGNAIDGSSGTLPDEALKFERDRAELKKSGVGITDKEVRSQEKLVAALQDTVQAQRYLTELKGLEKGNATESTYSSEVERSMVKQAQAERKAQEDEERLYEENRQKAVAALQQTETEKIDATEKGSAARLTAIDAAIKEENAKGLQETGFYRSLLTQRVNVIREMSTEEAKIKEEAGKEEAAHEERMGELKLTAEREHQQLLNSARRVSAAEQLQQEIQAENEDFKLKMTAYEKDIAALTKRDGDYQNKLKALQDKEAELTKAHENKITQIKDKAVEERNARLLSAEQKMKDETAKDLAGVLMMHQSFGSMILQVTDQVATGLIESALKYALTLDANKRHEAAAAARQGFITGQKFPFPINIVMAPTLAAAAFESVMGFEKGGLVPGTGRGDIVPAMLSPGEHVNDKELTDGLRGMVRNGGGGTTTHVHLQYRPTYHVNTIDGDGIRGVLTQHADEFQEHFEKTLRKRNQ